MPSLDIPDLSPLATQRSFIDSRPDKPSASSSLYTRRFSTDNPDGSRNHTVIGVHVVLGKGEANGLWEALHVDRNTQTIDAGNPKVATRALVICCDTLEVRGEFCLPEASVEIYARRLLWADAAAAINTSPLPWSTAKARNAANGVAGEKGAHGRNAGPLQLFLHACSPLDAARPRLLANGGRGQDPGDGEDGVDGDWMSSFTSKPFSVTDSGISTSKATVAFSPPAVYVEYEWRWAASRVWGPGKLGDDRFPKDGTNALAPGVPGNAGDAGLLTTNLPALVALLQHTPGSAGSRPRDYRGGSAGTPSKCAKYKLQLWENLFGTDNASFELTKTDEKSTKSGAPAPGQPAAKATGASPAPVVVDTPNAWLHPLGLQATLEFVRDLFLAGGREELLTLLDDYRGALAQPRPDTGGWGATADSLWTAAQVEVATLWQRLNAQLDYFGHPAGYTPLLSLPGSIKLYADETQRALRMLLLTGWIADSERDLKETAAGATELLNTLTEESRRAAQQVEEGEARIAAVRAQGETLRQELTALGNRLVELRNNLLVKVINDKERQAAIKFGIKMAGALCQVIPVGQPTLGTLGSLASVAADFVGGEPDAAPDTLSKMGDLLTKANEASEKAKKAAEEAKKKKDEKPAADSKEGKGKSSAWAQVGKGLGPAVSGVADALKALQVPKAEVDAALAQLEAEDPQWNALTREIRALNEKKAALFQDLVDALQAVGDGFARLSANADAVVTLQQQREKAIGKVDPQAVLVARQLGQRSRLTLQRYLYLMVKAYESTLLKPLSVDWRLATVTEKINELLKPRGGFDVTTLEAQAKVLDSLFQANLDAVREQLLREFDLRERTSTLRLGLSARQTPEPLVELNDGGRVVLDPNLYGLLLPSEQLARISNMALVKLGFDPAGPALPETANVVISVVPATTGTLRRGEGLYLLTSEAAVRWGWTWLGPGDIRTSSPSAIAKDVLDFVLGERSQAIRQKVALPPAWSDLTVTVEFTPFIPRERRPRITELYFEVSVDSSPAPEGQRVLSLGALGRPGAAVVSCQPPDLAGRGDAVGNAMRIYNKGQRVRLTAPDHAGAALFDGWEVNGLRPPRGQEAPPLAVEIKVDDFVLAQSHWVSAAEREEAPVVLTAMMDAHTLEEVARSHPDEQLRATLKSARRLHAPLPNRPLRARPAADAPVIGILPGDGQPDQLEEREGRWRLVNFRGVVGWVEG